MKSKVDDLFASYIAAKKGRESVEVNPTADPAEVFEERAEVKALDDPRSFSSIFGFTPGSVIDGAPDFLTIGKQGHPDRQKPIDRMLDDDLKRIIVGYVMAMKRKHKVVLIGDSGCGKTTLVQWIASMFELPFNRIQGSHKISHEDYIGMIQLIDGETKFVPGHLVQLMTKPGFIAFDEGFKCPQSVWMAMQGLMERNGYLRLLGEHRKEVKVEVDPLCFFSVTDNAKGLGENSDMYGTTVQDLSTLNRFEVWFDVPYLSEDAQCKLVQQWAPEIKGDLAKKLVTFGTMMRHSWKTGDISVPFTPRNLQTVAEYTEDFRNPIMGIRLGFAGMLPREIDADEFEVASHVVQQVFGGEYGKL